MNSLVREGKDESIGICLVLSRRHLTILAWQERAPSCRGETSEHLVVLTLDYGKRG